MAKYTKTSWVDNTTPAINATNLNNMETGIAQAATVYNVKSDYGAVGDGVTDDTTAITNAFNAACAASGVVYFPSATYLVSSITIPTTGPVRVETEQVGGVTLQQKSSGTGSDLPIFYANNNSTIFGPVQIQGINFVGAGQNVASGGLNRRQAIWILSAQDVLIRDCVITDFRDGGIDVYPSGNGRIYILRNRAQRCCQSGGGNILNVSDASIFQTYQGDVFCEGNYVTDSPTAGIAVGSFNTGNANSELRLFITGNTLRNHVWTGIAVESSDAKKVIIGGNQVYNCGKGITIDSGGTQFADTPELSYMHVVNNLIDSELYSAGAQGNYGIFFNGRKILIANNIVRATENGIHGERGFGGANFVEDSIIANNIVELANNLGSSTGSGISLLTANRVKITGNHVSRLVARVVTGGVVGAGGTVQVDTVEGWPASGTAIYKGATQSFTAVTQAASPTTNATITLATGATFSVGDLIFCGTHAQGITISTGIDCQVEHNFVTNPATSGIELGGCTRTKVHGNTVTNPSSQAIDGTATKVGIRLDGNNVDSIVEQNTVRDYTGAANASACYRVDSGESNVHLLDNVAGTEIGTDFSITTATNITYSTGNRKSSGVPSLTTGASTHPSDPAATTSTTRVMMGCAVAYTPKSTGRVVLMVTGDAFNTTAGDGTNVVAEYGTGTAPVNGAAVTGTQIGNPVVAISGAASEKLPFSISGVATGLTIGTALWFDLGILAITGGTAKVENLNFTVLEF